MKTYVLEQYVYVLGYLVLTGTVSFGICYRMGPVENVRTLNLIQWAMQTIALVAVFCSSSHQAASLSIVLGRYLHIFIGIILRINVCATEDVYVLNL